MTPELSQRISAAFNRGARLEERDKVKAAIMSVHPKIFSDLPSDVQKLIREIETRPRPDYTQRKKGKKK